jgi:hypothetical protein
VHEIRADIAQQGDDIIRFALREPALPHRVDVISADVGELLVDRTDKCRRVGDAQPLAVHRSAASKLATVA